MRRLHSSEWELWRSVRLEALADAPSAFGSTLAEWSVAAPGRWQARLREVPFNVIALIDDDSVGQVSATANSTSGSVELISMWVSPAARGSGVGDALIEAAMSWASEAGAVRVTLRVKETNAHAKRLYERHGFVDAGARDAEDEVRMHTTLVPRSDARR